MWTLSYEHCNFSSCMAAIEVYGGSTCTLELGQQYIGSTVCCITRSVQMHYKQCGLVDHNVVENVSISLPF